jgi:hypothetical protein
MPSPASAGLYGLVAGLLIGFLFALVGVIGLVRRVQRLRTRLDSYAGLPLWKELELAQARVDIAERALSALPSLQLRATRAARDIADARDRIRTSVFTLSNGVGLLLSLVLGDR